MQNRESYIGPEEIIRKKNEYMIPCVYHFYQDPVQMVRGEGQYVFDHSGKKYLDFYASISVLNAGHCHPEIVDKICEQVKTLQHTTTIYLISIVVNAIIFLKIRWVVVIVTKSLPNIKRGQLGLLRPLLHLI